MKSKVYIIALAGLWLTYCGSPQEKQAPAGPSPAASAEQPKAADPMSNKGVGPISSVTLGADIDTEMVEAGKELYQSLCTACHKETEKFIGPAPAGIMDRRSPEWIMNMILNPEGMVKEDPVAKQLLIEYNMAPMANQGLTEEQARQILEYFRTL